MSVRKLSVAETEALLSILSNRDCGQGCKCVFCRTFDDGYKMGLEDAATTLANQVEVLKRKLRA